MGTKPQNKFQISSVFVWNNFDMVVLSFVAIKNHYSKQIKIHKGLERPKCKAESAGIRVYLFPGLLEDIERQKGWLRIRFSIWSGVEALLRTAINKI